MAHDPVNHPQHYTSHPSGVECITITRHMNFNIGNAVKYLWRAGLKAATLEDLKKAAWYINDEIARVEKQEQDAAQTSFDLGDAESGNLTATQVMNRLAHPAEAMRMCKRDDKEMEIIEAQRKVQDAIASAFSKGIKRQVWKCERCLTVNRADNDACDKCGAWR